MNKYLKILCVCRKGDIRSVEIKRVLNTKGYKDVLSVGGLTVPIETLNMLCKWADIILLAKPEHGKYIEPEHRNKINMKFYLGDDLETAVGKQLDLIEL